MGSLSNIDLAYIAGFLDGDGSLMFQVKQRKDGKRKWRFMSTICFYQDSRHKDSLLWIREVLGIGYISDRNDGMTELRINGFKQIRDIIEQLLPYIRFKKEQAKVLYALTSLLSTKRTSELNKSELLTLVDGLLLIQQNNYATRVKKTKDQLLLMLGMTP